MSISFLLADTPPLFTVPLDNFYLSTKAGALDILKEVSKVGTFQDLKAKAIDVKIFGYHCHVISLDDLIAVKESMPRDKDKAVLQELKLVRKSLSKKT